MSAVCLEERHAFGLARLEVDQLEELEPGAVVDADRDSPLGGGGKADEPIPHGNLRHLLWVLAVGQSDASLPGGNKQRATAILSHLATPTALKTRIFSFA